MKRKYSIGTIRFFVDNLHVGTPDQEVVSDLEKRMNNIEWTPGQKRKAIKDALRLHHKNQDFCIAFNF